MASLDAEQRAIDSVLAGAQDPEAISEAYGDAMVSSARKVLGSDVTLGQSPEDVVGAVMKDIIERKIAVPPSAAPHLRAYLRVVARRKAIDLVRRSEAEARALERRHPLDESGFEDDVEAAVLAEQFMARMSRLNERERYVMIERIYKGRPATDVADELGILSQQISQIVKEASRKLTANLPFTADAPSDQDAHGPDIDRKEGTR